MSQSILVIDDTANWQEQLAAILRREGYTVETAGNYIEALSRLRRGAFDLLVVDLRLSDSDESDRSGMELLGDAYEREVPAIIVTGYATSNLAKEAYRDYGVYDFIPKDNFEAESFRESVKKAIATQQVRRRPEPLTPDQRKKFDETVRKIFRGETIEF